MSTPNGETFMTHVLEPYTWSTRETAAYEAAVEAVNGAVGAYTARLDAERAKPVPDRNVIDACLAARGRLAKEREALRPDDHEMITEARRGYAELTRQIREGSM